MSLWDDNLAMSVEDKHFDANKKLQESTNLIGKTADALHEVLVQMSGSLAPFPYFMGSLEVQAIEAEPGGANKADRGCIVVCADGEMYEFTMKLQAGGEIDQMMDRDDSIEKVNLPPEDYISYAFSAMKELATLLEEKQDRAKKYSY